MTIPLPSHADSLAPISQALDDATHDARVNWMHGLGGRELKAMYTLARSGGTLPITHFHGEAGEVRIHHGKNSLPMFTHFQKRVCLHEGTLQGYNHQTMAWLTGPGHFTLYQDGADEVIFDYIQQPQTAPEVFPALVPNEKGGGRFVYAGMIDRVRRVSEHCVIGAAFKGGKDMGARFMLTREPAAV
jgi:hypothetical protein